MQNNHTQARKKNHQLLAHKNVYKAVLNISQNMFFGQIGNVIPKRMARRTRKGSSKKVSLGGRGVTIFPDLRSSMPVLDGIKTQSAVS